MRLRYVRIRNLPPLEDVAITFGHERALGRACAIHFVVGVNGSGKSRLLQALAEIFLDLERQRIPAFPVTLAYERHEVTNHYAISLHHPGGVASNATFKVFKFPDEKALDALDWVTLHEQTELTPFLNNRGDLLPGSGSIGAFLPRVLVGYTSGATAPWKRIFAPPPPALDEALADAPPAVELESERPAGWSVERESELKTEDPNNPQQFEEMIRYKRSGEISNIPTIGFFVTPEALKWAVCATALGSFVEEFKQRMAGDADEKQFTAEIGQSLASRQRMPGLRGILNEVDWLWPETLSLRIHWRVERLVGQRPQQIKRLAKIATRVLRDPGQQESLTGRTFHFDLRRKVTDEQGLEQTTAEALLKALGGSQPTPLTFFRELMAWKKEDLLADIAIVLRKRNVPDLLLYDWLSDGERMFLGRMALFHLLRGTSEALLILDEPETHFNDVWKREIVDIIDEALGEQTAEVLITTHSSIALTDAFSFETSLFEKHRETGEVSVRPVPVNSFAALPGEILREVFGAGGPVGKRAGELLELVLFMAGRVALVESAWQSHDLFGTPETNEKGFQDFSTLLSEAKQQRVFARMPEEKLYRRLWDTLVWTGELGLQPDTGLRKFTVALAALEEKLGAGHYQFEVRSRLRDLLANEPEPQPTNVIPSPVLPEQEPPAAASAAGAGA